jgi:hypothetical protein
VQLPLPGALKKGEIKDAPLSDVYVLAARGHVSLNTGERTYGLRAPPGPAMFHWDSESGVHGIDTLKELPAGAEGPDKAALAFGKAICDRTCKFCDHPPDKVIAELLAGKEFIDRGLGAVAAGALDDLPRVLDALSDVKHADTRDLAVRVLRAWIGRGPGQAQKLYDALLARKYPPALARTVLQGLVGFSEEQIAQPALYDLLIALLDHKELVVRELAHWHLVRLAPAGASISYDAGAAPEMRAAAARSWRELIPEGKLPPRPKTNPEKK